VRVHRSSEGLVVAPARLLARLVLRGAEVVGLVAVVAVGDDRVFDSLALEVVLLVQTLQLAHQLLDEVLRRAKRLGHPRRRRYGREGKHTLCHRGRWLRFLMGSFLL